MTGRMSINMSVKLTLQVNGGMVNTGPGTRSTPWTH